MDGKKLPEIELQRKDTLKSLDYRQTSIKIDKGKVYINSTALFTRLAAVSKREVKVEYFFLL